MTDTNLLKRAIDERGVSITFLANALECTRNRIYSILEGKECTASEIVKITEAMRLTKEERDAIFLGENVNDIHGEADA